MKRDFVIRLYNKFDRAACVRYQQFFAARDARLYFVDININGVAPCAADYRAAAVVNLDNDLAVIILERDAALLAVHVDARHGFLHSG